jgi:predicted nucleic-acid-binding protein
VLAETIWELTAVDERSNDEISTAICMLLNHAQLALQDADVVEKALLGFEANSKVGFTD